MRRPPPRPTLSYTLLPYTSFFRSISPHFRICPRCLMAEVAHAGKHHRQAGFVGGGDNLLVADGAAGLDHRRRARLDRRQQAVGKGEEGRSEEYTSELQSLMRISYADFRLQKTNTTKTYN